MNKYYQVCMDDFEALPFCSEMDEGWEGHSLIIEEQCKEDFSDIIFSNKRLCILFSILFFKFGFCTF